MSRKWFKGIKSIIVQRGEDYYLSGRVKNIKQDGDTYTADVIGTEDYETSVEIVDDELVSCSCNCPYDGGICKHVAALLFAIEDETNGIENFNKFNYTKIEDENFHKVHDYVKESLKKLDTNTLLNFINKFTYFGNLDRLYEMESFIQNALNEKPIFDEKVFDSYVEYLKEIDDGKIYIELEEDDYDTSYVKDDHGIEEQLRKIISYAKRVYDAKFYDASKFLIYLLLTVKVMNEYDYGDAYSDDISTVVDDFDVDLFIKMYVNCGALTSDDDIDRFNQIMKTLGYAIKDYEFILSLPFIKDSLLKLVASGDYDRFLNYKFNCFVDFFKNDLGFFKKLLIESNKSIKTSSLMYNVKYLLEEVEKDKLIETVEYFKDLIDESKTYRGEIYETIYKLYKKYGFDYEPYLVKTYLFRPNLNLLLEIFKDPELLKKCKEEVEKVKMNSNNEIADFLLAKVSFKDSLKEIKNGLGFYNIDLYSYLLLAIFSKIDVMKLTSFKYIDMIIHKITNNEKDSYIDDYLAISESFLFCHGEESFDIEATFNTLVKLTEECINGCFGSSSKNGREFWPISLHVIDSLAFLLDVPSPNLWLKYSEIYKRYKEFRKDSEYWY